MKNNLQESVKEILNSYFTNLDGSEPVDLYRLMIKQVEQPMLEIVMQKADNNQSLAAKWLGVSRNTLRKMLGL